LGHIVFCGKSDCMIIVELTAPFSYGTTLCEGLCPVYDPSDNCIIAMFSCCLFFRVHSTQFLRTFVAVRRSFEQNSDG